jgi:ribose 5-phosphate isomerase A
MAVDYTAAARRRQPWMRRAGLVRGIAGGHGGPMAQDDDKRIAAEAAVAEVRDGMLVGLGTGSTARHAINAIGRLVAGGLAIRAVATSVASADQAAGLGIPLLDMADVAQVDLTIDGADEITDALVAIKGAGGAMLREKVVAAASRRMVVIADGSKHVDRLGTAPLPVEVVPFARESVIAAVRALGGEPVLRLADGVPYLTDQSNLVLDCRFSPLPEPAGLARALQAVPGVAAHGLFIDEVDAVYLARAGTVTTIERS